MFLKTSQIHLGFIDDAVSAAPDEPTTLDPMWWVELGSRFGKTVVAAVACVVCPEAHVFTVFFDKFGWLPLCSPHYI